MTVVLNPNVPPDVGESPGLGASRIRALTQAIIDLLGLPANTAIPTPITGTRVGPLTNRTGIQLQINDLVTFDPLNDTSVVLDDTTGSPRTFIVTTAVVNTNDPGTFAQVGEMTVHTFGAVTRGHYLRKSATGGAVEDSGYGQPAPPPAGALGLALSGTVSAGHSTVTALLWGFTVNYGGVVNPEVYGMDPSATAAVNREALQDAIDGLPANGGVLQFTRWGYHIDAVINVTKRLTILGPGATEVSTPGVFVLYLDTASQVGFNVTSKDPFVMRDLSISGAAGSTHVVVNGPTGSLKGTESGLFSNVVFYGGAIQLDIQAAIFWHATTCEFWQYTTAGARVQNTLDNDQGDSLIDGDCRFSGAAGAWGVLYQTGAGLKIFNNKFLDGAGGIKMDRIGTVDVTDLKISGNSIENFSDTGILITRSAGNLATVHLQITDNQIAGLVGGLVGIRIEPAAGAGDLVVGAAILNNLINNVATCLKLREVNVLQTGGNTLQATGAIWDVDATVVNVRANPDYPYDFVTFMTGTPGTNFVMQGGKLTVAQLPAGVSDGSQCFASDALRPGEGGHVAGGAATAGGSGAPAYFAAAGWRV